MRAQELEVKSQNYWLTVAELRKAHQCYQEMGNKLILHYISQVWQEWFDALKRNEGFNLQLINKDLMQQIEDKVKDSARAEELHEVSIPSLSQ